MRTAARRAAGVLGVLAIVAAAAADAGGRTQTATALQCLAGVLVTPAVWHWMGYSVLPARTRPAPARTAIRAGTVPASLRRRRPANELPPPPRTGALPAPHRRPELPAAPALPR
jgi:hypothetical protein